MNQMHRFIRHVRRGALVTGIVVLLTTGALVASGGKALAARSTSTSALHVAVNCSYPGAVCWDTHDGGINYNVSVSGQTDVCNYGWRYEYGINYTYTEMFWIKMGTTYCFDGLRVTYHRTWFTGSVTGPGHTALWFSAPNMPPPVQFNCYRAAYETDPCSGNHEHDEWSFVNIYGDGETCFPTIDEEENANGQFFSSGSVAPTCV